MKNSFLKITNIVLFIIFSLSWVHAQVTQTTGVRYRLPSGNPALILETTQGGGNSPHILFDARNGSASATTLFMQRQENNNLQFKSFTSVNPFAGARNVMTLTSNGRVGIGTTNPSRPLVIKGGDHWQIEMADKTNVKRMRMGWRQDRNRMEFSTQNTSTGFEKVPLAFMPDVVSFSGKVGIKYSNPGTELDVNGRIRGKGYLLRGSSNANASLFNHDGQANARLELRRGNTPYIDFTNNNNPNEDYDVRFILRSDNQLNFDGGNLMIGGGWLRGGYKFGVHGKMIAEEVTVQLRNNWPDYVFADDYNLAPLKEVELFIKENKHLPNIPSAKEMSEKDGLELGEMNRLLVEKVEELMLYTIEQEKRILELEKLAASSK